MERPGVKVEDPMVLGVVLMEGRRRVGRARVGVLVVRKVAAGNSNDLTGRRPEPRGVGRY